VIQVDILEQAYGEVEKYRQWYWAEGEFVGTRFDAALERAVEGARSNPEVYPHHATVSEVHNVRFVTLGKFTLSIIYQVRETSLMILALAHHSRLPGYWKSRVTVGNQG
jgi:toxin ParE1/3/4